MYKMLVLDMDGTLLNKHHQISKENFEAIQDAVDRGVKVILASGRIPGGIYPYLEKLNLISDDNYFISCSGGIVQNNTKTRIIGTSTLDFNDLKYAYNLANELNIGLNVYTDNEILVFSEDLFSRYDSILNNVPLKLVDFNTLDENIVITKINLIDNGISGLEKMKEFFHGIDLPDKDLFDIDIKKQVNIKNGIFQDITKLPSEFLEKYIVVRSTPFLIEITKKDCNKWNAVKKIAKELNITDEKIICIGDSENDIHMIKNAGLGVAMGNAFSNVKKISDFITYTNEENGVAYVINKFILNRESLQAG